MTVSRRFSGAIAAALLAFAGLLTAATGTWGALALLYAGPGGGGTRAGLAAACAAAAAAGLVGLCVARWRRRALLSHAVLLAILLIWWGGLEPSNDRDWQTDVSVLSHATVDGDAVTVHNVRNFDYRSETDYVPAYYDRRFRLDDLTGVDLVAAYWMGPVIAHVFVSFEFADGERLAVSIETRKEKGEAYSTLRGFFRQYEIVYVVADERDVIRLRTNYRRDPPESVYVYRMQGPKANARRLFMNYIERINELKSRPAFYNTLTTNCTTSIWIHTLSNPGHPPLDWKILVSGYVPRYLYEIGRLDQSVPFEVLQRRAHVNARARAAGAAPDFSRRIREPDGGLQSKIP